MSSVTIEKLRPANYDFYDSFLKQHPEALFYHSSKYKEFLQDLLGCGDEYLLAIVDGQIHGALPLLFTEVDRKRVYNSLPFYGSNGGIVAADERSRDALVSAYRQIACAQSTASATIVMNPFSKAIDDAFPHNFTDQRIAQFTHLPAGSSPRADLMMCIDSSARRNIQKAEREGITVAVDHSQFDRLQELHQDNIRAIGGLPKPDRFFDLIPKHFTPSQDFDLYVARKNTVIAAALLLFYFNETVEYFTPAIDAAYRTYQPLSLILIEAMIEASKRGYRCWNWGGTWHTQHGVYRFKKKWGADERPYSYYIQLNDQGLRRWPSQKLLETFPSFYVMPFSALESERPTPA